MDPLSQGTVGAAFAQSTGTKNNLFKIGVIGFLAGMAPDLDVLIQSSHQRKAKKAKCRKKYNPSFDTSC